MLEWIKKETLRIIPVFFFFLVTFYLINMTDGLMTKREGIPPFSLFQVFLGAAIVAKVFLLLDHLPFINAFSHRPLIYKVLWKTSLYSIASLLIRFLTRFVEAGAPSHFLELVDWPKFWAIQIWFLILLLHFVTFRELRLIIGEKTFRKIFLGR